jgi:hypothetical protein
MASTSPIRAEGAQHDLDDLLQLSVRGQGRGAGAQPTARLRLAASGVTAAVDDAFDQAQPFVRDYDPTLVVSCAGLPGHAENRPLLALETASDLQFYFVAGAGFEPATSGLTVR